MKKITIILLIVSCLHSCNKSLKATIAFPLSQKLWELEGKQFTYSFFKNKEFRKITNALNKKYGKGRITGVEYFESKKMYYCEFLTKSFIHYALILDENLKIISEEKFDFEY